MLTLLCVDERLQNISTSKAENKSSTLSHRSKILKQRKNRIHSKNVCVGAEWAHRDDKDSKMLLIHNCVRSVLGSASFQSRFNIGNMASFVCTS